MENQQVEAVLLTGGRSSRMGRDKSQLPVQGVPQAKRIVDLLAEAGIPVTVLGRDAVPGAAFIPDEEEFAGPLAALSRYRPKALWVFVASCDLPRFQPAIVEALKSAVGEASAAVPVVDGFRQPFCALYAASAFEVLNSIEDPCAMGWLDALSVRLVSESDLNAGMVDPRAARGANTPEEFAAAVEELS